MENVLESEDQHEETSCDDVNPALRFSPPLRPSIRMPVQRSSVCSRAYFVVVMVFFHVYILNVIALLLYVHYNNGHGDLSGGDRGSSAPSSEDGRPFPQPAPPPPAKEPLAGESRLSFTLPRIEGIRVGHVQSVSLVSSKTHKMKTLSLKPLLFEIPDFLSEEECRVVVQLAQLKGLMESQATLFGQEQEESNQPLLSLSTGEVFSLLDLNQDKLLQREEIVTHSRSRDGTWLSPDSLRQILAALESCTTGMLTLEEFNQVYNPSQRAGQQQSAKLWSHFKQKSKHTWLHQGTGSHHVLQTLRKRVTTLTRLPATLVDMSEPLQVVRYAPGDYSHAHHDSSPSHPETSCAHTRLAGNRSTLTEVSCRYLTVSLFLNSVDEGGDATFPVADNRTYEEQWLIQDGVDLTDTQETCFRGNLRIKPSAGTALLWYNHLSDGRGWMGELDEYSLHGDCPVSRGLKWVANSWVNVDPDLQQQTRYQRLVAQRRSSGREEHYQPLSHSELHQDL